MQTACSNKVQIFFWGGYGRFAIFCWWLSNLLKTTTSEENVSVSH